MGKILAASSRSVTAAVLVATSCLGLVWAQGSDEPDPTLKASAILTPEQLKGPNHTVAEAVTTPGFFHEFSVTSTFGTFAADGTSQVAMRMREIAALAALNEVSKTEVFVKAAGASVVKAGTGVANAVSSPVDTAKGIGGGIKRVGVNLGRRTQRAAEDVTADQPASAEAEAGGASDAAAGAAKSVVGINGAMRRWAKKVGADPYTTNPALREALEGVAKVDVAGGLAAKIAVPIPPVVGTTAQVGDLVWGRDPEELRKLNEQRAREIGASADGAKAFFRSPAYTLTMQTRILAALHAVRVPGVGDYLASAAEADGPRAALFFVESAEMLQAQHTASPVAAVLTDSRALVAKLPAGEVMALLPLDWVRSSAATVGTLQEIGARAKAELGATSLRLKLTGRLSERAVKDFAALGWTRVGA